jgi:hypothetical protein
MLKISRIPQKILLSLIKIYQKTLSPDHGWLRIYYPHGFCRFSPSCSDYGSAAIAKYGVIWGVVLASWRVMTHSSNDNLAYL